MGSSYFWSGFEVTCLIPPESMIDLTSALEYGKKHVFCISRTLRYDSTGSSQATQGAKNAAQSFLSDSIGIAHYCSGDVIINRPQRGRISFCVLCALRQAQGTHNI